MGSTNTEQRPVRVAGDTTSFTFCGLIPGQTYTMTITAIVSDQVRSKPKDTQATVSKFSYFVLFVLYLYLSSAQYLHVLQDTKCYLTYPTAQATAPTLKLLTFP